MPAGDNIRFVHIEEEETVLVLWQLAYTGGVAAAAAGRDKEQHGARYA